jgi:hypothetical protein
MVAWVLLGLKVQFKLSLKYSAIDLAISAPTFLSQRWSFVKYIGVISEVSKW